MENPQDKGWPAQVDYGEANIKDQTRVARIGRVLRVSAMFFVVLLLVSVVVFIPLVSEIEGGARVVNYAGIVRGATQQLVKQELMDHPNDHLINRLDGIIEELQTGEGKNEIKRLNDADFQDKLSDLEGLWGQLKQAIYASREQESADEQLFSLSEYYFQVADQAVLAAEEAFERHSQQLSAVERFIVVNMIVVTVLFVGEAVVGFYMMRMNRKLSGLAYIDQGTGLPNKRCCDDVIFDDTPLSKQDAVYFIMFDLNNLKFINDTFGHREGDEFIRQFAQLLAGAAGKNMFVGRFGGDEFIAVARNSSQKQMEAFLARLNSALEAHNAALEDEQGRIEYAWGCAHSGEEDDAFETMHSLMNRADRRMYENKPKATRATR